MTNDEARIAFRVWHAHRFQHDAAASGCLVFRTVGRATLAPPILCK